MSLSQLVTCEQFAEFLASEAYFSEDHWVVGFRGQDGDDVLDRIGFEWADRQLSVIRVSWYEADAYCRWRGGRLPTANDAVPHERQPEWLAEWHGGLKRVANYAHAGAAPDYDGDEIGFRVVTETRSQRRRR